MSCARWLLLAELWVFWGGVKSATVNDTSFDHMQHPGSNVIFAGQFAARLKSICNATTTSLFTRKRTSCPWISSTNNSPYKANRRSPENQGSELASFNEISEQARSVTDWQTDFALKLQGSPQGYAHLQSNSGFASFLLRSTNLCGDRTAFFDSWDWQTKSSFPCFMKICRQLSIPCMVWVLRFSPE